MAEKLLKAMSEIDKETNTLIIRIPLDVDYEKVKAVEVSDKGNRSVLNLKENIHGLTLQLNGWYSSKDFADISEREMMKATTVRLQEARDEKDKENMELKQRLAKMEAMMEKLTAPAAASK